MKAYDPFPRTPTSAARVRVRVARANTYTGYVPSPDNTAPKRRRVKKGNKTIIRIRVK